MKNFCGSLLKIFGVITLTGCGRPVIVRSDLYKPQAAPVDAKLPAPPVAASRYSRLLETVLQENCVGCHNVEKPRGQVDLSSYDAVIQPKSGKHTVVAGNADASLLYTTVRDGKMPRGDDPLSADKIALIKQYIDEGALP